MAKNENNKSVAHNMLGGMAASYMKKQQAPAVVMSTVEEKTNLVTESVQVSESNNTDLIYKTKDYDMFLPYPKAELRLELHQGAQREQLKNSIEAHGITSPIKVAPIANNKFVILSGHNRLDIAKQLGIEVPYIILKDLDEDTKDEIVAEEHILNRQQSDFKPSQMMKLLIAIRKTSQNQRELLEKTAISKTGTYRYLSLEKLMPELLYEWVDTQKLSLMSAESLSKVTTLNQQKAFYNYINNHKIRTIQEKPMKRLISAKDSEWTDDLFNEIFQLKEKTTTKVTKIEIPANVISECLDVTEQKNIQELIIKLLKEYKESK